MLVYLHSQSGYTSYNYYLGRIELYFHVTLTG